ncbi:MAG: septum formation protein Maf [Bacteriovoracaceae bacterium]|nr:septum formation protein Maf [Bacteriovoracaceae bacterium]
MESGKYQLILGSQSPRRKELLSWLNIPFKIVTADLAEISEEEDSEKIAMDLASQKAHAVWEQLPGTQECFVMASDTIVVLDGKLYGKPSSKDDARRILKELSGKTHEVITGVSFLFKNFETNKIREHLFFDSTEVEFNEISKDLLESYIATGDSFDKAGAYGIQGPSLTFISKINGSYSNVVGFPLNKIVSELAIILGDEFKKRFI